MPSFWRRLLGEHDDEPEDRTPERRREKRKAVRIEARLEWRDPDDTFRSSLGTIRDISAGGIQIESKHAFLVNQIVDLQQAAGDSARFVVRSCQARRDCYRIGLVSLPEERRRDTRIVASGTAKLRWLSEGAHPESRPVEVRDVSSAGMQVECPAPVGVGERVTIAGETISCFAVVRYCRQTDDGYNLGLEFIP